MIIRKLRPDENGKLDAIQSLAFSFSCDIEKAAEGQLDSEVYGAFLDDGETLTATIFTPEFDSFYCGKDFPSVGIGGVASLPEYRRLGAVRAIFHEIFRLAPERGWVTSFLYPFSCNYYRQFGYERLLKRREIKIPVSDLDKFPRNTNAGLYRKNGTVSKDDLLAVYNDYAANYNIMFRRNENTGAWSDKPHSSQMLTYLWYDGNGTPAALATVRCKDGELRVTELCYTSPDALKGILGFLRMFEGQAGEVRFCLVPADSELELLLGEYVHAEYSAASSAMGRILLPDVLLKNNAYPTEPGHFRLQIDDPLEYSRGVYAVEYGNGLAEVKKLPFDADYDISLAPQPLSRILFGMENFNARRAAYMEGVKLCNDAEDFFRAFPKRPMLLYEGF